RPPSKDVSERTQRRQASRPWAQEARTHDGTNGGEEGHGEHTFGKSSTPVAPWPAWFANPLASEAPHNEAPAPDDAIHPYRVELRPVWSEWHPHPVNLLRMFRIIWQGLKILPQT